MCLLLALTACSGGGDPEENKDPSVNDRVVVDKIPAPVASFTAFPLKGIAPVSVKFETPDSSGTTIFDYQWDFGDGKSSTDKTKDHQFTQPGTYTVTLTVTNSLGVTDQATTTIEVADPSTNLPPTASIKASLSSGKAPLTVEFDGSASTDPDGFVLGYVWDFDDGNSAGSVNPSNTFTKPGEYKVTLRALDEQLAPSKPISITITVEPSDNPGSEILNPDANFIISTPSAPAPYTLTLDASSSTAPEGSIIESYQWNTGDGRTANGKRITHTFKKPGTYTVSLKVIDEHGLSSIASRIFTATLPGGNHAPTAVFSATPRTGLAPLAVRLDATASYDIESSVTDYLWDFGDGNTATGAIVNHTFTTQKLFTVQLKVKDTAGAESTATRTIDTQGSIQSTRVYHIGNSVTDGVKYEGLKALAETRGKTHSWGRHMIPGAPLEWIWEHPAEGFNEEPYGLYPNALPNFAWDAVIIQPFDRPVPSTTKFGNQFYDLALKGNLDTQLYVLAFYPRRGYKDGEGKQWGDNWVEQWEAPASTNTSRKFFESVARNITATYPEQQPVLIIPVGEVMFKLNQKIEAGQVPGLTTIWDLYADDVHLNGRGSYLMAVTHFVSLYREDPRGLPLGIYDVEPEIATIIQETVWEVMTTYDPAGLI